MVVNSEEHKIAYRKFWGLPKDAPLGDLRPSETPLPAMIHKGRGDWDDG